MLKGKGRLLVLALSVAGLACILLGPGVLTPGVNEPTLVPGVQTPGTNEPQGELPQVEFPLQPDPLTIQVTLDESRAVSSRSVKGVAMSAFMQTTNASGASFEVNLPGMMTVEAADGSQTSAAGTTVTMTPIKSVEGLPFSGGLLAGLQFSPEGLQMAGPATVSITLPGYYDPSQLVVFVASGSGEEFHLYPAALILPPVGGEAQPTEAMPAYLPTFPPEFQTFMPPTQATVNGTLVMIELMHFSMFGVAQATVAEITALSKHPPSLPMDQVEQMLAQDIEEGLPQSILLKEYNKEIKPGLVNADCGTAVRLAQRFLAWHNVVKTKKLVNKFQPQIKEAMKWLRPTLKACLELYCHLCLEKVDASMVELMVVRYFYYVELGNIVGDVSSASIWYPLINKCAVRYGFPEPLPYCCNGEGKPGPTPVVACPGPALSP